MDAEKLFVPAISEANKALIAQLTMLDEVFNAANSGDLAAVAAFARRLSDAAGKAATCAAAIYSEARNAQRPQVAQ